MHAMSPTLFQVKGYRARWAKTAVSICLIAIGAPIVVAQLLAAVPRERLFILGYFLVLSGFAWIFASWAVSTFGRRMARYAFAAVIIMAAANLAEDFSIQRMLGSKPGSPWLSTFSTVVSAAAVIKCCAAVIAFSAVAAVVGLTGRGAVALFRRYILPRIRRDMKEKRKEGSLDYASWWNDVLAPPELPVIEDSVVEHVAENESSWFNAYNVPGVFDVIKDRKGKPAQAICLSGGGVRSACVAMGAMQIFSETEPIKPKQPDPPNPAPQLIDTVDYIISVSGGGYTAGARLLATQQEPKASGTETVHEAPGRPLLSQRFEHGSAEFDHFRRGSSYIADSAAELANALAVVLKNLIASLGMLFAVPAILGWAFGYLLAVPYFSFATFVPVKADVANQINHNTKCPGGLPALADHHASWWAVGVFAILAVLCTMGAIFVEWRSATSGSEAARTRRLNAARGSAVFALLVLVVVAGLPALMWLCSMVSPNPASAGKIVSGAVGLNYVTAIVTMLLKKRDTLPLNDPATASRWTRLLPPGVLQLILVLATFALLGLAWLAVLGSFAVDIFQRAAPYACHGAIPVLPSYGWFMELVLLGGALLFLGFADVTSLSLHPFYRLRLARTFAVRRVKAWPCGWQAERYPATEWTWLPDYGQAPAKGPKFVFATAATLSGAATPAPGLNAVSYVLSADHIGGPDLGWLKTQQLWDVAPPRIKRDLTVEASVAVSGAAFASAMGRQNKGYQKLLAVSGARLGTWLPNPKLVANLVCAQKGHCPDPEDETRPWPTSLPTIRGSGYFYRELFGINYEDARLVQLTDGGHYENLGLVEALRRRCRLIFCIDAGGDSPPLLTTLSDAMRLAEYELGVTIELNEHGPYSVNDITPGSGKPFPEGHAFAGLNGRLTKGTVAFGRIKYPLAAGLTERRGILVFAKAVLWDGCPDWLLTYAANSAVFPHDPTSDQWFNEAQFAAYTSLGTIMGTHAAECAKALERSGVIS
jgi:hypothetical protein